MQHTIALRTWLREQLSLQQTPVLADSASNGLSVYNQLFDID